MLMVMMMMTTTTTTMMTMMSRRMRTGYLRIVILNESAKNTPLVTVQQYFCTLSHSQQSVQAATQHVNSTVQKYPCMSFHWSGGTVTVVAILFMNVNMSVQ